MRSKNKPVQPKKCKCGRNSVVKSTAWGGYVQCPSCSAESPVRLGPKAGAINTWNNGERI